jgi:hypothetical protein
MGRGAGVETIRGAFGPWRGLAAGTNGSEAKTWVVEVSVETGRVPMLARWAPWKIVGSARKAPTAPASETSAIARGAIALMEHPHPADILTRESLRQCAAEA